MIYYVYFDAYGHARKVINQEELVRNYNGDPDEFLKAASSSAPDAERETATGHVGTLKFDNEADLHDYLRSLGDEIEGFYWCDSDSRPYNF